MGSMKNWMLGAAIMAGAACLGSIPAQAAQFRVYVRVNGGYTFLRAQDRGTFGPPGTISAAIGFRGVDHGGYRDRDRFVGRDRYDRGRDRDRGHDRFRR